MTRLALSSEPTADVPPQAARPTGASRVRTRNQDLRSRTRLMRCSASLVRTRVARPRKVVRSGLVKSGFWWDSNRGGCHYF